MKAGAAMGLALWLVLDLPGCGSPAIQQTVLCPIALADAIDVLVSAMVDEGYSILDVDEVNKSVVASKAPSGTAASSCTSESYRVSVELLADTGNPGMSRRADIRQPQSTKMVITVKCRGHSENLDQETVIEELVKRFAARSGQPVEVLPEFSDDGDHRSETRRTTDRPSRGETLTR